MKDREKGDGSKGYLELAALVARKTGLLAFFQACHGLVKARTGAVNMFVALLEGEDAFIFPFVADEFVTMDEVKPFPRAGLTAVVIAEGRPRWLSAEPDLLEKHAYIGEPASDWIGIPFADRDGRPLGALVVQSYDEGFSFDEGDFAFLRCAAYQVSLAIQLHANDREIAVRRIAALVEESSVLDHLYAGIHAVLGGILPVTKKSLIIARIDPSQGLFRPVYCVDEREGFASGPWPLEVGLSGYVASSGGRSLIFEDGVTPEPQAYALLGERPVFWLGVPLRSGPEVIGIVITQTYDRAQRITLDDLLSLEAVCPYIATAITRMELFNLTLKK